MKKAGDPFRGVHPIQIKKLGGTRAVDQMTGTPNNYVTLYETDAEIRELNQSERIESQKIQGINMRIVTIRYLPDITYDMRIYDVLKDVNYSIEGIANPNLMNQFLIFTVKLEAA